MNPGVSAKTNSNTRSVVLFYGVAAVVSLIGLADAIYLTIQHITGESVRCTITSGCSEVLGSPYAVMFGIPLAELGAVAYFTVFALATLGAFQYKFAGRLFTVVVLLMFVMTLWLVYLQAFVIRHFCQFCLLSALVTTTLAVLALIAERSSSKPAAVAA
jgi:uncharacterized membrane protein